MPRKGPAPKRPVIIDPVYGSPLVTSLINKVLLNGKRSTAERIVYGAMEGLREKTGNDPIITLKRGILQSVVGWPQMPGILVSARIWGMHGDGGNWFHAAGIIVNAVVYTGVILVAAAFMHPRH